MGVRRQSPAASTSGRKPRFEVRGHPDFAKYRSQLKASQRAQDRYLERLVDNAIGVLEQRMTAGQAVPRDRWPADYRALDLPCLFRYRLDANYRMTYSIVKIQDSPPFVWIIEVMDHTKYNRRFGYD